MYTIECDARTRRPEAHLAGHVTPNAKLWRRKEDSALIIATLAVEALTGLGRWLIARPAEHAGQDWAADRIGGLWRSERPRAGLPAFARSRSETATREDWSVQ
jgi:hypothetical protein